MVRLGIDFGTTHRTVARVRDARAEVVVDQRGHEKMPSVVYYGDGETLVGWAALEMVAEGVARAGEQARVVSSIKRRLLSPPRIALAGGRTVTPVQVAGEILGALWRGAQQEGAGADDTKAIITYPAMFDSAQLAAVHEAVLLAGLDDFELLEEPV